MWLVKETDFGKAEPTIELHEEQKKKKKAWGFDGAAQKCGRTVRCPGFLLQGKGV
jgi:hypothetical protein